MSTTKAKTVLEYIDLLTGAEREVGIALTQEINHMLGEKDSKIWHGAPVWFIKDNPIVGYSKIKSGIKLMFWSGADFDENGLKTGSGKFKDASITYNDPDQINAVDLQRWLKKARTIQWDYKNIVARKGKLVKIQSTL